MTEIERIEFLVKCLEQGHGANFARRIGIDPAAASRLRNGQIRLSRKYVEDILKAYPQVSREWLETGEGYPGDLSIELVRQRYSELLDKSDRIIDLLTREVERQGKIIDMLLTKIDIEESYERGGAGKKVR